MVFGPDSNLYVASTVTNNAVLHFDATSGSFLSTYIAPAVGGLGEPRGLAFDQDGRLYVADVATSAIHRFDNQGQFLDDPVAGTATNVRAPSESSSMRKEGCSSAVGTRTQSPATTVA